MFPNQGEVKSAGGGCVVCWSPPTLFPYLHAGYTSHWKYEPFKMNSSYTEPSLHQNKQKPAHNLRGRVHIHTCSPGSKVAGNLPDPLTNTQWPSFRPPVCAGQGGIGMEGETFPLHHWPGSKKRRVKPGAGTVSVRVRVGTWVCLLPSPARWQLRLSPDPTPLTYEKRCHWPMLRIFLRGSPREESLAGVNPKVGVF